MQEIAFSVNRPFCRFIYSLFQMNAKLKNFQRLISGTVVELELVRQHRDSLQNQLSRMEQAEHVAGGDAASNAGTLPPSSMAGGPGSSRMMIHDDVEKKTNLGKITCFLY